MSKFNIIANFYGVKKLLYGKSYLVKRILLLLVALIAISISVFASDRSYLTTTNNRERLYIDR